MAAYEVTGLDELAAAIEESSDIPEDIKKKALTTMAEIHAAKQKSVGESMNIRDPESDVHILDTIKVGKPKLDKYGGSVTISFSGRRKRGNSSIRNSTIAFMVEFGKKKVEAKPFIATANEAVGDKASDAGMDVIYEWIKSNFEE